MHSPHVANITLVPRFSLLQLEFGEIYFEDFSAVYFTMDEGLNQGGAVLVDR